MKIRYYLSRFAKCSEIYRGTLIILNAYDRITCMHMLEMKKSCFFEKISDFYQQFWQAYSQTKKKRKQTQITNIRNQRGYSAIKKEQIWLSCSDVNRPRKPSYRMK